MLKSVPETSPATIHFKESDMDLMSAMEHALCVGTAKMKSDVSDIQVSKRALVWPAEFRDPVEAALHLGTPRLSRFKTERRERNIASPAYLD